jgi:hypothetical protein
VIAHGNGSAQIHVFNIGPKDVNNDLYPLRFRVHGEYVCELKTLSFALSDDHLQNVKDIISKTAPEETEINGMKFIKRKLWQSRESIL